MANGKRQTSGFNGIVDLGHRLYERALVRREQELITDPRGQPIGWLLDTRIPMLDGEMAGEVGEMLAQRLRSKQIEQVAGFGFGAFAIVGAVVAAPGSPRLSGGFVRDQRKPHGRRRLVEGPLDRNRPLVLLDDILNSGRSAASAISLLRGDGYDVVGLMTLFNFTWSGGRKRIEEQGLWVDTLLDLNLRENSRSSSDSPF